MGQLKLLPAVLILSATMAKVIRGCDLDQKLKVKIFQKYIDKRIISVELFEGG